MLVAFQAADELLKGNPEDFDQTTFDLWFDLQMEGLAAAHYWQDEPEQVEAVLEKVRPVLGARRALQRQSYENAVGLWLATKYRHGPNDEMLASYRRALAQAEGCCEPYEIGWRVFGVGWCLFLQGELTEAEETLTRSLAIASQIGTPALEALSLCYLTLSALRRHERGASRVPRRPRHIGHQGGSAARLRSNRPSQPRLVGLEQRRSFGCRANGRGGIGIVEGHGLAPIPFDLPVPPHRRSAGPGQDG